ncbi:MAG: sigma-70 family RNA polymerase sigma factor [Verrucomicrobiota bacterium]
MVGRVGEFARVPAEMAQFEVVRGEIGGRLSRMLDYESSEDEYLVGETSRGDLNAFDEIVRRHQTMITRCLFRFCPHQSDLEDLVQETFLKAYRKIDSWQATAPFENWLRKIAYNTGYDFYRKNSRNPASISKNNAEENENTLARLAEPETHRREYEMSEQAHRALALLNAEERMLLTLQYLEETPLQEIADQMGWGLSKNKVKSFRARKKLKKLLVKNGIVEEEESPLMG